MNENFKQYIDYLENFHKEAHALTVKKAKDYTNSHEDENTDPMQNFLNSATVSKISVEQGIVNRMVDKLARVISLSAKGSYDGASGEKLVVDMQDLANYAGIIAYWVENNYNSDVIANLEIEPDLNSNPTTEQIDRELQKVKTESENPGNYFLKLLGKK